MSTLKNSHLMVRHLTTSDAGVGFIGLRAAPTVMSRPHTHLDIELNFLLRGSMRYFIAGRFQTVPPQRLAVFWAGIPHQVVNVEAGTEFILAGVPLAWFIQWQLGESFMRRLLRGEFLMELQLNPVMRQMDRAMLERWAVDLHGNSSQARKIVMLELEARMRRLALSTGRMQAEKPDARRDVNTVQLERVTEYVGQHYSEKLSITQVAAAIRLHPNYLMNIFKRGCGMSLWEYVIRLRVSHAQRLLITTDLKVLDIALESGFGSVSCFYEAFERYCGTTPKKYRAATSR